MRKTLFVSFVIALALAATASSPAGMLFSSRRRLRLCLLHGSPLSDVCRPYFPCGSSKPSAPSGLTASALSGTRCSLSWIDGSTNETSFRIEAKSSQQTFFEEVGSVGANVTTATVSNLTPETTYFFRVRARGAGGDSNYSTQTTVTTPAETPPCAAPTLCFAGDRFRVEARWQTRDGAGNATVVRLSPDSGYLWFFAAANAEAVFKIIDACSFNGSFWFYAGGLTDVQTSITVTDTVTGRTKTYTNPQGTPFKPIQDTSAFSCH